MCCVYVKNQVSTAKINLGAYFLFSFAEEIDFFNESSKVEKVESVRRIFWHQAQIVT